MVDEPWMNAEDAVLWLAQLPPPCPSRARSIGERVGLQHQGLPPSELLLLAWTIVDTVRDGESMESRIRKRG